jgi:hypothetical protein
LNTLSSTLLEEVVGGVTGNIFLREFSVTSGKLRVPAGEIEVADVLVLLRGMALILQVKDRHVSADASSDALAIWFRKKVRGQAVGQIADTYRYLQEHEGRVVQNDRGHDTILSNPDAGAASSVVIYRAPGTPDFRGAAGARSSRAGFVHFVEAGDYLSLCQVLRTPHDLSQYWRFRENTLKHVVRGSHVGEKALVGQFLADVSGPPHERYAATFESYLPSHLDYDISGILQNLGDRVTYRKGGEGDTSHYHILEELALLPRIALAAFKERLKLCVETVKAGEFRNPSHFAVPNTDCGFLFAPWDRELNIPQEKYLETLTRLSKYTFGTRRQVGLAVSDDGDGFFILWAFLDEPHTQNPDLDAALAAPGNPLPPTKEKIVPAYYFDSSGLERVLGRGPE